MSEVYIVRLSKTQLATASYRHALLEKTALLDPIQNSLEQICRLHSGTAVILSSLEAS